MAEPQINTGTDLGSVVSDPGMKSLLNRMDTNDREGKEFAQKTIDKMEAEPKPKPPTMTPAPDMKDYQTDPMQSFGSGAGFLATFGSLLTRRPLTNALNAGAAVMNAANQKNAEGFKAAFDKWKLESENAWKMVDWDMEQYKAALGKDDTEAKIYASAHRNETASAAIQARMGEQYHKDMIKQLDNSRKPASKVFEYVEDSLAEEKAKREAQGLPAMTDKELDTRVLELTNEAQTMIKKNGIMSDEQYNEKYKDDPEIKGLADSYSKGVPITQLAPGWGKDNPKREAVMRKAYEMNPDLDWADAHVKYVGNQSGARSLATQTKKIDLASNMLDTSLPSMLDAAKKVGLSTSTDLNTLYNTAKRHFSDKDFSNFSTQLRAVTSDYAQFIGRGRMTVHSDQEALRILSEDMGITSLQGFADAVNIERKNVDRAIKMTEGNKTSGGAAGKPPDTKHIKMLKDDPSEENKKYFDEAFGPGAAAKELGE